MYFNSLYTVFQLPYNVAGQFVNCMLQITGEIIKVPKRNCGMWNAEGKMQNGNYRKVLWNSG